MHVEPSGLPPTPLPEPFRFKVGDRVTISGLRREGVGVVERRMLASSAATETDLYSVRFRSGVVERFGHQLKKVEP
jgi:hypothetical protein